MAADVAILPILSLPTLNPTMAINNPEEDLPGEDTTGQMFLAKPGFCFWISCFRSNHAITTTGSPGWERIRSSDHEDIWWARATMKVREWSELAAGPKWKVFIRRFNKSNRSGCSGDAGGDGKYKKFQYDPLSYALNFDPGQNGLEEDDHIFRDFSSRYASIPTSAKSPMDIGKDSRRLGFCAEIDTDGASMRVRRVLGGSGYGYGSGGRSDECYLGGSGGDCEVCGFHQDWRRSFSPESFRLGMFSANED